MYNGVNFIFVRVELSLVDYNLVVEFAIKMLILIYHNFIYSVLVIVLTKAEMKFWERTAIITPTPGQTIRQVTKPTFYSYYLNYHLVKQQ